MIKPPYLQKGDCIGIVAPARKISYAEIEFACKWLENEGFKVVYEDSLFEESHQFAGKDTIRRDAFQKMLDDRNIKAILCARGGYGSVRIIDQLDFTEFCKYPKWICGYSDVSVFHAHIHQNFGISTLHATMPINMVFSESESESLNTLLKSLYGEPMDYQIPCHPYNTIGIAEGELIGGNLSILYSLMGSPSEIDTTGKILVIEDLDEYLYHIDRMIVNLKRAGKLEKLSGLIVGGMSEMRDNTIPFGETAEEIIIRHCKAYGYPICFGFPVGHIKENWALKMGVSVQLEVTEKGSRLLEIIDSHEKKS